MLIEYLRMAFEALRSNKLRSMLTLLGMVIGVFSVIASVTAVGVIDRYFNEQFSVFTSSAFDITRSPAINIGMPDASLRNRPNLTYADLQELQRRVELPAAVSPNGGFDWAMVTAGSNQTDPGVEIRGVDEEWATNSGFDVEYGRFLTDDDVRYGRPVAVIGEPVARVLFPNESAIGKEIRVRGHRYQVIGVIEAQGAFLGQQLDNFVLAPITRLFQIYGRPDRNINYNIRVASPELMTLTIDEVVGQLRVIRNVRPQDDNNFEVTTNDALQGPFQAFTSYLTMGGAAIGLIALLAAGIGIMNIMLVSVTERTREIGIRKALGATNGAVLGQFLFEAVVLCQIGGLFGIALGVLGGNVLAFFTGMSPAFPWNWAIGGVLGVTVIALIFGVYPAWKAAKLRPIDALRYE